MAMATSAKEIPQPRIIREEFSRGLVLTPMSNFRRLPEAVLELVDNAIDEFDGHHGGEQLQVSIQINKDKITVENVGGKGMGVGELKQWLKWGTSTKVDAIGEYGQGGKGAMGYLGNAWKVNSKRYNEDWVWEIHEDNWLDTSVDAKEYEAIAIPNHPMTGRPVGYCRIEIGSLQKRNQRLADLKTRLSNIYRKILLDGKADGKVTITVNEESIEPLAFPIYEGFKVQHFDEKTSQGWKVKGWVGRLKRDALARGGPPVPGGMRLLRKGRLIFDGEYFGHPGISRKMSLNQLIGEVEMGRAPVLPNKTDFDRDSGEWEAVASVMHSLLRPHIDELLRQREQEVVTREEKKRVNQVRDMMIEALRRLRREDETLADESQQAQGRKRPKKRDDTLLREPKVTKTQDVERKPPEPRTPPPEDAVGRLKRLGASMPKWEIRPLEPEIRSTWDPNEQDHNRVLVINKQFPLYKKRDGDDLYIAETAALELAKSGTDGHRSPMEYLRELNIILTSFCKVLDAEE